MAFVGERRFVGLGFGAIQAGLFAYEAQQTGDYAPPLVVDVRPHLVEGVRADGGRVRVNIARTDRVDVAEIGQLRVADSSIADEQVEIIEAVSDADELATALPSVAFYRSDLANSPHRLLAEGLRRRTRETPLIVYCAENRRNAAVLLEQAVLAALEQGEREQLRDKARFADTVIGKMSGVISDAGEIRSRGLATICSSLPSAILVEEFDRILVSQVDPGGGLHPGMLALREVDDLGPFEDAKLLGHNATHALGAFLGGLLGRPRYADLRDVPGMMGFLRTAFIEESGRALMARYAGIDPLFTPGGYAAFADDLLTRMVNPYLGDTTERAARDPQRKLGWDDRMIGLIRLGLAHDVPTSRYAMGVAAGLDMLRRHGASGDDRELLTGLWPDDVDGSEVADVLAVVRAGRAWLECWKHDGFERLTGDV